MMLKHIFSADTRQYKGFIYLADFKAKHLFKVCRLADEEQIKGPAPAEVGHDDCIDGHGGEEFPPGGLEFLFRQTENQLDVQHLVGVTISRGNDRELTSIAPISWALSPMLSSM